jgi:hypothetical protein
MCPDPELAGFPLREISKDLLHATCRFLGEAGIMELPEGFGQLASLEKLWLTQNGLRRLPSDFGNLRRLRALWIGDNLFKEVRPLILLVALHQSIDSSTMCISIEFHYIGLPHAVIAAAPCMPLDEIRRCLCRFRRTFCS